MIARTTLTYASVKLRFTFDKKLPRQSSSSASSERFENSSHGLQIILFQLKGARRAHSFPSELWKHSVRGQQNRVCRLAQVQELWVKIYLSLCNTLIDFHNEAMPLGHVPVLEIDGKKMSQSISICRFLAKKVGLAGNNEMEDFEIDSVIDTVNDFRMSK